MTPPKESPRVALYARVSTSSQTADNQLLELRQVAERHGWEVIGEYVDHAISGAKGRKDRPQLDAMLKAVTRREVDMVAAWSVDRLGRSLIDLVGTLQEIRAKDVGLYLHQQGVDTTTPAGRAMFQMMGVFAEFEQEIIRERVKSGLARAKEKPREGAMAIGRPRVNESKELQIVALREQGWGVLKVARELRCGVSTVQRVEAERRAAVGA